SGLSLEREREGLARRLEQLSAVSGGRFLVVFDGSVRAKRNAALSKTSHPQSTVSIAFSKAGQTADNWILKYLARRPRESAMLVTRDRELAQKAKKLGFRVEADLSRLEAKADPYRAQPVAGSQSGGDLLSSLSRQSREALAQARKKSKKS
ncbi:MAG: NYN domain-containing protein, partial [candidate division Zixibacteria bacterium]|nr:NYN domain-containing protein [candidate division Zixibacteria bacterium]